MQGKVMEENGMVRKGGGKDGRRDRTLTGSGSARISSSESSNRSAKEE